MALLTEKNRLELGEVFGEMREEVLAVVFTQEYECDYCRVARGLLEELALINTKLKVRAYDFESQKNALRDFPVDKVPAIALIGDRDYGVRFYGAPSGYQFMSLIGGILAISRRDSSLPTEVRNEIKKLRQPAHVQVLTAPSNAHSSSVIRAAHRLALESPHVRADMVAINEFPHLTHKFGAGQIPAVVINGVLRVAGDISEMELAQEILKAAGQEKDVSLESKMRLEKRMSSSC